MQLPNGSSIAIASTIGAVKAMSALSNAAEAVATLEASHGVVVNDVLIVTSGWELLNGRVVRASAVATNDVTFEDIDTSSTANFPAAGGTGSVREVTAWTEITDILNPASSGGEQQFYTYQTLRQRRQKQLPTTISPVVLTMQAVDDITQPWYAVVKAAAEGGQPIPIRITLSNGGLIYMNGFWGLVDVPTLTVNEGMLLGITFSMDVDITRYSA